MKTLFIVLAVAVLLLYMKWILLVVLYPLQALAAIYRNHPSAYTKILAAPNAVFNRIIGGGAIYHLSAFHIAVYAFTQVALQRVGSAYREKRGYAF